jgi:hypothetical protein
METIHLFFDEWQLAYVFCVFWLVTYSGGLRHTSIYLVRVAMIAAYTMFMWSDNQLGHSIVEYAAQCLVMFSWIGFASQIFQPRF